MLASQKKTIFETKNFDLIAFGLVDGTEVELAGYLSKIDFCSLRCTATENHKLDVGTWYVPIDQLAPTSALFEVPQ